MKTTVTILALLGLLFAAAIVGIEGWNMFIETDIGFHGWLALGLGTVLTALVGGGLMALVFYSARHGHDEAADNLVSVKDKEEE